MDVQPLECTKMVMADIFDYLDQVMRDLHARLIQQDLGFMLKHGGEFRVVRMRAVNEHFDTAEYEASTVVSTAGGLLIDVATSFSDLSEWPEKAQTMTDNLYDAVISIAEQAEEIEARRDRLQEVAAIAVANAGFEGAYMNLISVAPHSLFVEGSIHRGVNAEIDFIVTMTMLDSCNELQVVMERVTDGAEFVAHFDQHTLPEQVRRAAELAHPLPVPAND